MKNKFCTENSNINTLADDYKGISVLRILCSYRVEGTPNIVAINKYSDCYYELKGFANSQELTIDELAYMYGYFNDRRFAEKEIPNNKYIDYMAFAR